MTLTSRAQASGATPTADPRAGKEPAADLTGRGRMVRNVLFSWGGFMTIAVAAFLQPRVMDRCLGQASVGIWDFGWSLVAYFSLAQFGVGSAITNYVAAHRARSDRDGVCRVVASVNCINWLAATIAFVATGVLTYLVPRMLSGTPTTQVREIQWVVALLGATVAFQIGFAAFAGVLGGCHRFDLSNLITATFEVATSLTGIAALLMGRGLVTVAAIGLALGLAGQAARVVCAYRVCPEMSVRARYIDLRQAWSLLKFGLKSQLGMLSGLAIVQGNKLFVGIDLGPAMLAVFSRPLSLLKVVDTFANRMGNILSPSASSLQATGKMDELRTLLEDSTRAGLALALPMVLTLAILGDPIMVLWMGSRYLPGPTVIILATGMSLSLALSPVRAILQGLNRHGRVALAHSAAAVFSLGLGWLNAHLLGWGLAGASLAIALPSFLVSTLFLIGYASRCVKLPIITYLRSSFLPPLGCAAPLAIVLLASRFLLARSPFLSLVAGLSVGGLVLLPLYWRYLLTPKMRDHLRGVLVRRLDALREAALPRPAG